MAWNARTITNSLCRTISGTDLVQLVVHDVILQLCGTHLPDLFDVTTDVVLMLMYNNWLTIIGTLNDDEVCKCLLSPMIIVSVCILNFCTYFMFGLDYQNQYHLMIRCYCCFDSFFCFYYSYRRINWCCCYDSYIIFLTMNNQYHLMNSCYCCYDSFFLFIILQRISLYCCYDSYVFF